MWTKLWYYYGSCTMNSPDTVQCYLILEPIMPFEIHTRFLLVVMCSGNWWSTIKMKWNWHLKERSQLESTPVTKAVTEKKNTHMHTHTHTVCESFYFSSLSHLKVEKSSFIYTRHVLRHFHLSPSKLRCHNINRNEHSVMCFCAMFY